MAPHMLDRLSSDAIRAYASTAPPVTRPILLTGVIRPLTRPLEKLFDVIVAAELARDAQGTCTGFLTGRPWWESRARRGCATTQLHGIDLAQSFAYADSHVDLPCCGRSATRSPSTPTSDFSAPLAKRLVDRRMERLLTGPALDPAS